MKNIFHGIFTFDGKLENGEKRFLNVASESIELFSFRSIFIRRDLRDKIARLYERNALIRIWKDSGILRKSYPSATLQKNEEKDDVRQCPGRGSSESE